MKAEDEEMGVKLLDKGGAEDPAEDEPKPGDGGTPVPPSPP